MAQIRYHPGDIDRLTSLCEQFQLEAKIHPKLYHATRVVIEPLEVSPDDAAHGWEEFLPNEDFFEAAPYERRGPGVLHSCYYGENLRLKDYTGLAATGVGFLSRDLCPMMDNERNARFDRDVWTLALYRIACATRQTFRLSIDLTGNGVYARADAQNERGLLTVVTGRSKDTDREKANLLDWQCRVAGKLGKAPKYVYASLALDVFQSSVIAIEYLRSITVEVVSTKLREIPSPKHEAPNDSRPQWDRDAGELRLGGVVVKRVGGKARNLQKVLDAFEAAGWPPRIDDPLIPVIDRQGHLGPDRLPNPERLSSTIKSLNMGLERIRFHADGTGKGVRWERL